MTPEVAAAAIIGWYRGLAATGERAALDAIAAIPATVLTAADRLADAADSDDEAVRATGIAALFGGVVEPLNDSFEPTARALYARIFARVIWRCCQRHDPLREELSVAGIHDEAELVSRHAAVRAADGPCGIATVNRVVVLSRVTIGADVLLTSVLLQRLHQRWPEAELVVLGDPKLEGLFGGLPQVRIEPLRYQRRGPLGARLASWISLRLLVGGIDPDVVIGPDSRLDQLGLLPVLDLPGRYLLWENTQADPASPRSLATLLDAWCARRLGLPPIPSSRPKVAFDPHHDGLSRRWKQAIGRGVIAIKLDHGGNPAKALPRASELALLRDVVGMGWRILIDYGFGDEEEAASDALMAELRWTPCEVHDSGRGGAKAAELEPGQLAGEAVIRFHGSIAGWAAALSACDAAISYDSVGHHLAAALGIPLVSVFTGFEHPAFPAAWAPVGLAPVQQLVIPTAERDDERWPDRVSAALPPVPA